MIFTMSYGTQLRAARDALKLTVEDAAEHIGVSRVAYTDWEAERAFPTKKHWPAIEAVLGIKLVLTALEEREPYDLNATYAFIARLNVRISAGNGHEIEHEEVDGQFAYRKDWLTKKGLLVPALRVIEAEGDSMSPTINDGDTILINTADRRLRSGEVYVFRTDEGPRLKRLHKSMDGRIRIVSDNPDKITYPDEWLTPGMEAEILGNVVHRSGGV